LVGLDEQLEDLIFEAADAVLCHRDLVLHRGVFLVRLHLHQLVLELGETALDDGEILFERTAGALIIGLLLSGGVQVRLTRLEARIQRCERGWQIRQRLSACLNFLINLLQANDAFQIGGHRVLSAYALTHRFRHSSAPATRQVLPDAGGIRGIHRYRTRWNGTLVTTVLGLKSSAPLMSSAR